MSHIYDDVAGPTQGEKIALYSKYAVEIWVSDTQNGTYKFLVSLKVSGGDQSYPHKLKTNELTRWYKLRYRLPNGYFTDFNSPKKGETDDAYKEKVDGGTQYGDLASLIGVLASTDIIVFK